MRNRSKPRHWQNRSGLLVLATVGLLGCRKPAVSPPAPPPEVLVSRPLAREIIEWDRYPGRLASPAEVEVRARVGGYLESIHFKDGQSVEKGQLLFVIDQGPLRAEAERAEATLRQAESQASLAKVNLGRAQELRRKGVTAQGELDTATTNFTSNQAAVDVARSELQTARLNLGFSRISSPISGRIGRRLATEGNLVQGGNTTPTLLTTIVSLNPIYAYFEVDERAFLKYQALAGSGTLGSLPVEMQLATDTGFPHRGILDFVDNRVDLATSTVELRGVFQNPNYRLTPGLFVSVRIPASARHPALLIPDQALATDQSQQFVYIVDRNNQALYRKVETGPLEENFRVIRSGLSPEDRVIVGGLQNLRPGMVVQVEERPIRDPMAPAGEPNHRDNKGESAGALGLRPPAASFPLRTDVRPTLPLRPSPPLPSRTLPPRTR